MSQGGKAPLRAVTRPLKLREYDNAECSLFLVLRVCRQEVFSNHRNHQSLKVMWYHVPRENVEQIPPPPSPQKVSGTCVCKGRDTMLYPAQETDHLEGRVGVPLGDFLPLHTMSLYLAQRA